MKKMKTLFIAALSLASTYAGAQAIQPLPGRIYQIISSDGYAFGNVDGAPLECVPDETDETQIFEFIDSGDGDGSYLIRLVADDSYLCKSSANNYDILFQTSYPLDDSKAKWTVEEIEGTEYVAIKNNASSLYWGWDLVGPSNVVWADKTIQFDKNKWTLVAVPVEAVTLYADATNRMLNFMDELGEFPGVQTEISDFTMSVDDKVDGTDETYYSLISEINDYFQYLNENLLLIERIYDLYDECDANLSSEVIYPGMSDLEDAYMNTQMIYEAGDTKIQDYLDAYDALKEALHAYYDSQIPVATEENPADLTYHIKYPNFRTSYNYDAESTPTSEGWIINNTNLPGSGYDYGARHKYSSEVGVDVTCFNNWSWQFDVLEIYQDIEGLPEGHYTVECVAYTGVNENYKQHAFATSDGVTAVSNYASEAMSGAWESFKTSPVAVVNGKLRIGFSSEASEEGGSVGWYIVTGFRLKYCGPLSADEISGLYQSRLEECRAQLDTMIFNADKLAFSDSISKYESAVGVESMKIAIDALALAQAEAQKSVDKQVEVENGILAALTDSITDGVYTDVYSEIVQSFCQCMTNAINAETATYTEMDSLSAILYALRDSYIPVLKQAKEMEVVDVAAKSVLEDNINRQSSFLASIETLPLESLIIKYVAELENAMKECRATDIIASGTTDYTSLIVNPTIDDSDSYSVVGWTVDVTNTGSGVITGSSQQYDGNVNGRYLDSWHWGPGVLQYNAYQTIENLPNGKYELKATVRTTGDKGTYLYAFADNDSSTTVLAEVVRERINITDIGGPTAESGEDSIAMISDCYGSIFVDAYFATNGGTSGDEELLDIVNTNNGRGFGWFYRTLEIEVYNHVLTIGYTCDSTFTMKHGGVAWDGTWLSADNFSLTLLSMGNNEGWSPTTGISAVGDESNDFMFRVEDGRIIAPEGTLVYSVNGMKVDSSAKLDAGIYILRYGRNTAKVMIR